MSDASEWATRMLRVYLLLPPRSCIGARSSIVTLAPRSTAANAAHRAALPPPTTRTPIDWSWVTSLVGGKGPNHRSEHEALVRMDQGRVSMSTRAQGSSQPGQLSSRD